MGLIRFLANFLMVMAVWTVVGQIPYNGQKLEARYHSWVSSPKMQNVFDVAFAPARWSKEKVASLWNDFNPKPPTQAR